METFNPVRHIAGSSAILEPDVSWPDFYESEIYSFKFYRSNLRPDDDCPVVEASIVMTQNELPYVVDFKFTNWSSIEMFYFNYQNVIEELSFSFEERGFAGDGVTPLLPYICVKIGTPNHTVSLTFKCFEVEVIGLRDIKELQHA